MESGGHMDLNTSECKDFFAEEIRFLRDQLKGALLEARSLERYALVLTGVVWTWLLTNSDKDLPEISWWIPFFLAIVILTREASLYMEIRRLAGYLRAREELFLGEEGGWETEVWRTSRKIGTFRAPWPAVLFWVFMIGGTALGPLLFAF
jgi:hypothetical protein